MRLPKFRCGGGCGSHSPKKLYPLIGAVTFGAAALDSLLRMLEISGEPSYTGAGPAAIADESSGRCQSDPRANYSARRASTGFTDAALRAGK